MSKTLLELLPYSLAAINLCAIIWFFLLFSAGLRKGTRRADRDRREQEAITVQLRASIDELQSRVRELQEAGQARSEPVPPKSRHSIHLNHRTQVLRMSRRGEQPHQIAAALGVPQGEVDLLLKIHHTLSTFQTTEPGA